MQPAVIRIYAAYKYNVLDLYQRNKRRVLLAFARRRLAEVWTLWVSFLTPLLPVDAFVDSNSDWVFCANEVVIWKVISITLFGNGTMVK